MGLPECKYLSFLIRHEGMQNMSLPIMDDYWKGEIRSCRISHLYGPAGDNRYLAEILWFYTKDQILSERGHGNDVKWWA